MYVKVRVFATLRRYLPDLEIGETLKIEVKPNTTIGELASILKIPSEEIKISMLNNLHAEETDVLHDMDEVAFFPPVGGG